MGRWNRSTPSRATCWPGLPALRFAECVPLSQFCDLLCLSFLICEMGLRNTTELAGLFPGFGVLPMPSRGPAVNTQ